MLFVSYWELNENMAVHERLQAGQKIVQAGLQEPEGVQVLRWDATSDGWGITVVEADSAEAVFRAIGVWRSAAPGFFTSIKTSPALPVTEAMSLLGETAQAVGS